MTAEWIKQKIEEAHQNAIDKGFYECPECGGQGFWTNDIGLHECEVCNGTGVDQNKNIGELLMLIVSELGEALEAHRCGRFADWKSFERDCRDYGAHLNKKWYGIFIKDTFEDEIADVFIRLFDLCGYVNLHIHDGILDESGMIREYMSEENIGECLCTITKQVCDKQIIYSIMLLVSFCRQRNIPIEKHIDAKMAYNKTRQ